MSTAPTLRTERGLLRERCRLLAAMDEVGRGSLAGPVSVGVVVVDADIVAAPAGVRDSKLLSAVQRERLAPLIEAWARDCAVGHASNEEIDDLGIIAALRLAGRRALEGLRGAAPDLVLLDGSHDWLTGPEPDLFADPWQPPAVVTRVKADRTCASVAAASVLAKVERDNVMRDLAERFPEYGWVGNKGYASADHIEALRQHGPTPLHRVSWSLPGLSTGSGD